MPEIASTYSIVAMDIEAGEIGAAVQSHFFSVASAVLWVEPGAGAVATQSVVNRQFGPDGLGMLASGKQAPEVLEALLKSDPGEAFRQAAVLDVLGNSAVHTGSSCVREAGHRSGQYFSVQANMMLTPTVWEAMEAAFLSTPGSLSDRMLAALKAAEHEGGDIRGKQSAGMKIVKTRASGDVSVDTVLDLRVEDHQNPLAELERLLDLNTGYSLLEAGDTAMEKREITAAMDYYRRARELLGENPEALYWHGVALLEAGDIRQGLDILKPLFDKQPNWLELTRRLPESRLASFDIIRLMKEQE